jgi:hypothetical protein
MAPETDMIRSNTFSDMWPMMITAVSATGDSCGKITFLYSWNSVAPSIFAASRRSSGMPRRPARNSAIT